MAEIRTASGGTKLDLRNVPAVAWYCFTVVFVAVLAGIVVLSVTGSDLTEFKSILNIVGNFAAVALSGGSVLLAGAAAKNSQDTKEQTNGQLDARIEAGVARALAKHQDGVQ